MRCFARQTKKLLGSPPSSPGGVFKKVLEFLKKVSFLLFQVFAGNFDRYTVVSHDLKNPIIAKVIRINPIPWRSYISLRVEFYGCREGKNFTSSFALLL